MMRITGQDATDLIPRDDPASPHYQPGPACRVCGEDMGPHSEYIGSGDTCEYCQGETRAMTSITLKAKIVGIEDASLFTDATPRLTMKFQDADGMFNRLRIRYTGDEWRLGDDFELAVSADKPFTAINPDVLHQAFLTMTAHGSSFERRLGELGIASDQANRQKIANTWPEVIRHFM